MEPLVSIITPVYNRAGVISRAIRSVQAQSYTNWELLLCDDGSTDGTTEVITSFQDRDKRIGLLRHDTTLGAADARNTPMRAARGKYIAFLDSDDEWFPEKLSRQVAHLESLPENVGVCLTGAEIIKNRIRRSHDIPCRQWEVSPLKTFTAGRMHFTTSTIVIRRSCLETTGLMTSQLRRGQDEDLLLRLFLHYGLTTIQEIYVRMHLCTTGKKVLTHVLLKTDFMISKYCNAIEMSPRREPPTAFCGGDVQSGRLHSPDRTSLPDCPAVRMDVFPRSADTAGSDLCTHREGLLAWPPALVDAISCEHRHPEFEQTNHWLCVSPYSGRMQNQRERGDGPDHEGCSELPTDC